MKRFVTVAAITLMTVTLVACSTGSPTSPSSMGNGAALDLSSIGGRSQSDGGSTSDSGFINSAAMMYQAQIELGKLAEYQGAHPWVKWFGRQMVAENTLRLASLRAMGGVSQNNPIVGTLQALVTELSALRGSEFDRRYTQALLPELEAMQRQLQQQSSSGSTGSALRAHASDFATRLLFYLDILRELVNRTR